MTGPAVRRVDPRQPDSGVLAEAAQVLREGGLVAFPTETVYGLGANAHSPVACQEVYRVKGRPHDNPLIVHLADLAAVEALVGPLPPAGRALALAFWPGPLTLVVPRPPGELEGAAAGLDTVAVRVPSHPVAQGLLRAAGLPVAAPSANRSSRPSPTEACAVLEDLEEAQRQGVDTSRVLVLDGGPTPVGVESTVVDVTFSQPRILRLGGLPPERIAQVLGSAAGPGAAASPKELRRSPGTRYRHYAPRAPLWVFEETEDSQAVREALKVLARRGERIGVLASPERFEALGEAGGPSGMVYQARSAGGAADPLSEGYARRLFAALRELDREGVTAIVAELPHEGRGGWAPAVRDRLLRAAQGRLLPQGGSAPAPARREGSW